MSLEDWLQNGWLVKHKTSTQEIKDLLKIADRDIRDSQRPGLSEDWRLAIAYNAALQSATAALAATGYRASRVAHHYRVIQSLTFTLKLDQGLVDQLDSFRHKRNVSDYEQAGAVSEQEAKEMLSLARELRAGVESWIGKNHSQLNPTN